MDQVIATAKSLQPKDALLSLLQAPLQMDIVVDEDKWCGAVLAAISGVKDAQTEINSVVEGLQSPQVDALMRAVYVGLEKGDNCTALLKWHGALYDKGGVGSIVRFMCDNKKEFQVEAEDDNED
ncbi:MAG: hypothetical protein EZS28_017787 [Streblomastix strix]|uniref:Actin-related protein 2/3 complex subunit 5 n=1 Tax=Streblomastix strix TaxID=222440 RepID=A0A5J4VVP6_9EUKA|nr:MAG: hypothetical protein EZS28_017787 [Streblomastix strix]